MRLQRRAATILLFVLLGCGGGGGGGGFLGKGLGLQGVWSGTLGKSAGDQFDMEIKVDNTGAATVFCRITESAGISTGSLTGTGPATGTTSGAVSLTGSFDQGSLSGNAFTYSGTLNSFTLPGNYKLGPTETGALTLSKLSDTTANVAGHWTGNFTPASGASSTLDVTFTQQGNTIGGSATITSATGSSTTQIAGSIVGAAIDFQTLSDVSINFTGQLSDLTHMNGTLSGHSSGTFNLTKPSSP